ncbi:MAG: CHAT domain-containing protein [candidate division NC10 bacterium]|nr:CHAT domain-containing protein [candidate division NC10 bacterium]
MQLDILKDLGYAELQGGNFSRGLDYLRRAINMAQQTRRGTLINLHAILARMYALAGDLEAADNALQEAQSVFNESLRWRNLQPEWIATWNSTVASAQASVLEVRGRFAEAEVFHRRSIAALLADPTTSQWPMVDLQNARLALLLIRQGRLLEAESEARTAVLGALSKRGRYSHHTALQVTILTRALLEQGRYLEAESLSRATLDIYEKTGTSQDSYMLALVHDTLGASLVGQGRWEEAAAEYEAMRRGLAGDPWSYEKYLAANLNWGLALLSTGRANHALEILQVAFERNRRLLGEQHASTAEARGLLAVAYAAMGDRPHALREFAQVSPLLLTPSPEVDEETAARPARDQRKNLILASYIGLLADIKGTALEQQAGVDAAAEAFRLADVARGSSVQRALDASAARAAAKTPALAELVRQEQDTRKQIGALYGLLANVLSAPTDQQDPKVAPALRTQIEVLRRTQQRLAEQIRREFPAYAELINPTPATVDKARAGLTPGEALIATYVARDRTFVWAIPHRGPVAFAAAPLGETAIAADVGTLRKALDPGVSILGDIPEFDVALAHKLYTALLEPVRPGWQPAESLLIVPHAALGQLPFSLLPTRATTLGPAEAPIFANYRAVPWLIRSHAVTVLPSVSSLATLRALPPAPPGRRPFVGFGDPYFSQEQARRAARRSGTGEVAALRLRGVPIMLRASPKTQALDSSQLAMLPRLPDTAQEIRGIALAMNADLTREVFLGERANEQTVKTMSLSGYRVIAFATHGLVPGDLDGLSQPALALSAPDVAQADGDGVLTMEEILGLRLNADWVVLSACNTASGSGAGSEAVSGLGRAFFYAGARALLVSNWPVETTSARALTTELFQRQQANPNLTRAQALQQTMNWLMDAPGFVDATTNTVLFSYGHPIFWAPFTLVGDSGGGSPTGK